MAKTKYLKLDNVRYRVHIIKLQRSADTLDKYAYRTEDGNLHRKTIGTFYNYSVEIGIEDDIDLYDRLYDKLSSPVNSMMVQFPNESSAQRRYISSVSDEVSRILSDGTIYKSLSFKATCVSPSRKGA